ncbi:MAG TPA: tetratricopeptide repeat protein [Terracidiphilus sp.]
MTWHFSRILIRICLPLAALSIPLLLAQAQEPSASLKQADADYRAGAAAVSRNDLKAALADFQSVVRLAPSAEQGHAALGSVLLRLERNSEAIGELQKALVLKPGDKDSQLNLAIAYQKNGQPAKAIPLFAKLEAPDRADKRSMSPSVLSSYAYALAEVKQLSAATQRMREAAAGEPHNAELQDDLGSLYAQQQDWTNASRAFSAALEIKPDFAAAHLHLGLTMQAQKQPGALDELQSAYHFAPRNPIVALELGKALANAGDDEHAIPVLQRAVELDPSSIPAMYQQGLALQRVNRTNEAVPLLQRAAAADPDNAEVLTNLGMALCMAQRAKDAVPILQRAAKLNQLSATARQNLAVAYIQLSQFDDAIVQLRAALSLSPNAPQLHYNLGYALKMQDDAAGAIPELEAAEKLDPAQPEAPYLLGVLYMQAGRYADAERELNVSLKLRPANSDGWATLGSVYNKLDKLPEAASALHESIRQDPRQPDARLTLAAVLVKQNQPAEATGERRKAAELMRARMDRQRAEVATNSAKSLLSSGKVDDAVTELKEALTFDPNYPEAHLAMAKALDLQGKTADAAAERQKATDLEGKFE